MEVARRVLRGVPLPGTQPTPLCIINGSCFFNFRWIILLVLKINRRSVFGIFKSTAFLGFLRWGEYHFFPNGARQIVYKTRKSDLSLQNREENRWVNPNKT